MMRPGWMFKSTNANDDKRELWKNTGNTMDRAARSPWQLDVWWTISWWTYRKQAFVPTRQRVKNNKECWTSKTTNLWLMFMPFEALCADTSLLKEQELGNCTSDAPKKYYPTWHPQGITIIPSAVCCTGKNARIYVYVLRSLWRKGSLPF